MKRNKEFFDNFLSDFNKDEVIDVVEFDMGYIPFTIERVSDGELLYLNEDNRTYSFKEVHGYEGGGGGGFGEYTWGRLFRDHRCPEAFRAIGWVKIENLMLMHKHNSK